MAQFDVTYDSRSVNTKRLADRVVLQVKDTAPEFIRLRTTVMSVAYDFSQFTEYLELFMEQLIDEKEIVCFDIVGDLRNNTLEEMGNGRMRLLIEYQQYNCLNITRLNFDIQRI